MATTEMDYDLDLGESITRLGHDLRTASADLSRTGARFLVYQYYAVQDERIRSASQLRKLEEVGDPTSLMYWVTKGHDRFETAIRSALGVFAKTYAVGEWLQSVVGIGPVISAGLLSEFDVRRAQTVGHFWRFAGLDPTLKWDKGAKRPYNAFLKTLCAFKLGESFVKTQNHDNSVYGKLYAQKKAALVAMNERGKFADQAVREQERAAKMRMRKDAKRFEHWADGKLAPAHIHDRARRWAVKLFLSHLHHVMYVDFFGKQPPAPYIFEHPELGDHRHKLDVDWEPGRFDGRPLAVLLND